MFLTRVAVAASLIALVAGVALLTAAVVQAPTPSRMAVVGAVLTLGALTAVLTNRTRAADDDALAAAHSAGYRLALEHTARGLLTKQATDDPTPPHGLDVSNVRELRPLRRHYEPERKAAQ